MDQETQMPLFSFGNGAMSIADMQKAVVMAGQLAQSAPHTLHNPFPDMQLQFFAMMQAYAQAGDPKFPFFGANVFPFPFSMAAPQWMPPMPPAGIVPSLPVASSLAEAQASSITSASQMASAPIISSQASRSGPGVPRAALDTPAVSIPSASRVSAEPMATSTVQAPLPSPATGGAAPTQGTDPTLSPLQKSLSLKSGRTSAFARVPKKRKASHSPTEDITDARPTCARAPSPSPSPLSEPSVSRVPSASDGNDDESAAPPGPPVSTMAGSDHESSHDDDIPDDHSGMAPGLRAMLAAAMGDLREEGSTRQVPERPPQPQSPKETRQFVCPFAGMKLEISVLLFV